MSLKQLPHNKYIPVTIFTPSPYIGPGSKDKGQRIMVVGDRSFIKGRGSRFSATSSFLLVLPYVTLLSRIILPYGTLLSTISLTPPLKQTPLQIIYLRGGVRDM